MASQKVEVGVYGIELELDGKGGGVIRSKLPNQISRRPADILECVILAHACAGVKVDSPEYREGLVTALDAISNLY